MPTTWTNRDNVDTADWSNRRVTSAKTVVGSGNGGFFIIGSIDGSMFWRPRHLRYGEIYAGPDLWGQSDNRNGHVGEAMTVATYQPGSGGIDTYVNVSTETGHGTEATLSLNTNQRILIKFDISDISSTATCSSAVMSLYSYVTSAMTGDTWTAYPILVANSAWDEAATWNTRDGSNN
ncbi:MAG: DNRLRE domain-containing protein [Elusimicrobia bacterium]|nr:DNRLRE domain-containing protein [Elusimicrobiota bacterium]